MRAPWRRQDEGPVATADPPQPLLPDLTDLDAKIATLETFNRAVRDPSRDREILRARHLAGIRVIEQAPADPRFPSTDAVSVPAGAPLPEFRLEDLTPELMRAAILRDGCVLVRSLISPELALELAEGIDVAYGRRDTVESGGSPDDGYYEEFVSHQGSGGPLWRSWIKEGGGLLGADSPALSFRFLQALRERGVDRLVTDYLGERALISAHKTTMRRAEPAVSGAWHQDGRFMGPVRALNLWLSLSHCGDDAPGLDMVPVRLEDYLATGTEDASLTWTISDEQVRQAARGHAIIRPIFEPGDAVFFDELFLHKTGSDPSMPMPRYAVENWFFGGSAFPADYAPIAV